MINVKREATLNIICFGDLKAKFPQTEFVETFVSCFRYCLVLPLCLFQVHRLVITDKDDHVKGIVSLSDILTFLVLKPMGMYSGY